MENNKIDAEKVLQLNTAFLETINRSDHYDYLKIEIEFFDKIKVFLNFDTIIIIHPLMLSKKQELLYSAINETEYTSMVKVFSEFTMYEKRDILNNLTEPIEITASNQDLMPLFDRSFYQQIVAFPVINTYRTDDYKGCLFYLNKNKEIDLSTQMMQALITFSESISMVLNSYRKLQLYKTQVTILNELQLKSKEAICIFDNHGLIIFSNKIFNDLVNKNENEIIGNPVFSVLHLKDYVEINDLRYKSNDAYAKLGTKDDTQYVELVKEDGKLLPLRKNYSPIIIEGIHFRMVILEDIAEEIKNVEHIEQLNLKDVLTKLKNRNYYEKNIANLIVKEKLPVGVIVGDINGLKLVNDIFGHTFGDEIIKKIANILHLNCHNGDVYRMGGDEFYLFLNNSREFQVQKCIKKINEDCNRVFSKLNFIGISLGYYIVTSIEEDVELAIRKAESEMYYVKSITSESNKNESIESLKRMYSENYANEYHRSNRLVMTAIGLAPYLQLKEEEVVDLCNTLELVDIGKVAFNTKVLGKSNEIDDNEFDVLKKHCRMGYKIASLSYETSHLARLILNHHENYDGTGFPLGLKGNRIPFLSRVIRIIDYYDSFTESKQEITTEDVIKELQSKKNKLFDPVILEKFIIYIKEKADE